MATRTPLILNQVTARVEELSVGDTLPGGLISGYSGKNRLINGSFAVWQRGTTFNGPGYTADRWYFNAGGVASPNIVQNPISPGQFSDISSPAFARVNYGTITDAAAHFVVYEQMIEGVDTFSGKIITLRFKVYNSGASGRQIAVEFRQNFGVGGSTTVDTIGSKKFALVPGINTITHTVSVPSVSGKTVGANNSFGFSFWVSAGTNWNSRSDSLGSQTGDVHFTEVQIEEGDTATPFENIPLGDLLQKCYRYCYLYSQNAGNAFAYAVTIGTSGAIFFVNPPVPMRTKPSATARSGLPSLTVAGAKTVTAQNLIPVSTTVLAVTLQCSAVPDGAGGYVGAVSGQDYQILLDAEL